MHAVLPRLVRPWAPLAVAALLTAGGCGWKTALEVDLPRPDGGTADASLPELTVDCGRRTQYTSPRRPITLVADVSGSVAIVEEGWELALRPSTSSASHAPDTGPVTTLTPDVVGTYVLDYAVTDSLGRQGSCEVTVEAIVGPPAALCPEDELVVRPGETLLVEGDGYDDEAVVAYLWSLESVPPGASVSLAPLDAPTTQFQAFEAGNYALVLKVFDADGASGECTTALRVVGPPEVTCPPSVVLAPTRRPTRLAATATDDRTLVETAWEILTSPYASMPTLVPTDEPTTYLTPDRQGTYLLRFTATDDDSLSSSCEVEVLGTPTPPTAVCPARVQTRPLTPTTVTGSGIDDGTIVSYAWTLVSAPSGSNAGPPLPPSSRTTTLEPDIVGDYVLRLTVTDDDGETDDCETTVAAVAAEGLRIELFWDAAPDMDLHLLHPAATTWNGPLDCYYANCNSAAGADLEWFAPGAADNPHLDIDDTNSFGPENINIETPALGTYRVGVHAYYGNAATVSVRVYCGGSTTTPRASYGPVALPNGDLWRVVDVTVTVSGCSLASLALPGGAPNIDAYGSTMEPR